MAKKRKRRKPNIQKADLQTPAGRRKAWSGLIWGDHGFLRYIYSNIHQISDKMWRSYQPAPLHLKRFADKGVRTVINLRGPSNTGFYRLEEEACERLGLTLVDFQVYSRDVPSKEMLHEAKALFNRIEYPAVMHCKSGADRAGFASALYMFVHEGRPLDEALDQLSLRYGHISQGKTGILDYFFEQYKEYNEKTPIDFYDWVDTAYDPAAVKASFMGQWWANILTDKILRRE